ESRGCVVASALPVQQRGQLASLALRQAADRLRGSDPAVGEDLVDLHPAVLGDGQEHVEYLGRLDVLGRIEQERVDRESAGLGVALELGPLYPDLVGSRERIHSLVQSALWCPRSI